MKVETKDIWVVIPAYNEGEVIRRVVDGLLELNYSVVVVDDCSRDQTLGVLKNTQAHLLRHAVNLGQGAALQTGISYALKMGARIIVTFDADGQHQASEIVAMVAPIAARECDATLGSRFLSKQTLSNVPKIRSLVLKLATLFTRLTSGLELTDTHNGFRAFSAEAASKIYLRQNRMAHASEILSQIAQHKLNYREVPVTIVYSEYSLKKGQKLSNSLNIVWDSALGFIRR